MTAQSPTVSIVVPVYNGQSYIEQAVHSLLDQSHGALEIIAVNDGSTDDSLDILNKFRGHITIIDQANQGQAASLNRGWAESQGEYLGYLSCDDFLSKDCLSRSVEFLEGHPDFVATYCDYDLVTSKGQFIRTVRAPDFERTDLVVHCVAAPGPGAVFRKSAWQQAGGWRTHLTQMPDFDFWLRLSSYGQFCHLPESLATFRIHEGSQSYALSSPSRADEPQEIVNHYFDNCEIPGNLKKLRPRSLAFAFLLSARLHLRSARLGTGMQRIRMALAMDFTCLFSAVGIRLVVGGLVSRWRYRKYAQC